MANFSGNAMLSTVLYGCHFWQYSDMYNIVLILLVVNSVFRIKPYYYTDPFHYLCCHEDVEKEVWETSAAGNL